MRLTPCSSSRFFSRRQDATKYLHNDPLQSCSGVAREAGQGYILLCDPCDGEIQICQRLHFQRSNFASACEICCFVRCAFDRLWVEEPNVCIGAGLWSHDHHKTRALNFTRALSAQCLKRCLPHRSTTSSRAPMTRLSNRPKH